MICGSVKEDMITVIKTLIDYGEDVMRIITAEICIKLMIANKLHNADILAELLMMHFDTNYFSDSSLCDEEWMADVKEVGSPTRLLQMLSIFFPAYALTNDVARTTLITCLKSVFTTAYLRIKDKKTKPSILQAKKVVGYVCSLVNTGIANKGNTLSEKEDEAGNHEGNNMMLSAATMIAETMVENHENFSKTFNRGLCVALGTVIGALEDSEVDVKLLESFKDITDNLEYISDDEKVLDELEEIQKVLDTIEGISPTDKNNDCTDEEQLSQSLNQVTLQEGPDLHPDELGNHKNNPGFNDAVNQDCRSSDTINDSSNPHSPIPATSSNRLSFENNVDPLILNASDEGGNINQENEPITPLQSNGKLTTEIDETERRCLAPLNK